MIIRSKAPFRLGLSGGGTDVSPYSDMFGGAVLNTTINLYAKTTIIPREDGKIVFTNADTGKTFTFNEAQELDLNNEIDLQIGVYNRIIRDFCEEPLSFEMITSLDVPTGSGLGTSSTLVVSMIGAFAEWLKLPLGEYDIARLAFEVERIDLGLQGGKQDQYAATFGGVNFLEFLPDDKVIVNPLRTKKSFLNELNFDLILYYTNTFRDSPKIIEEQIDHVENDVSEPIEAMHEIKKLAFEMKQAFITADHKRIGPILNESWINKKKMAKGISNDQLDKIYEAAMNAGATGGKISGAGGGGFMLFFAPKTSRYAVIKSLESFGGEVVNYQFSKEGLYTWTIA
jgi:D-glycero-alpha-D-manno-heptose-7-phosphate kinase